MTVATVARKVDMPRKEVPPPLELVKRRIEELLPPDARREIDQGRVVLIDVRDPGRYQAGHLKGAVNVASGESARGAHSNDYAEAIKEAGAGPEDRLILYCGQGNRSARTADALRTEHGFESVASIIGGAKLWSDLGYPVEGEITIGAEEAETDLEEDGEG